MEGFLNFTVAELIGFVPPQSVVEVASAFATTENQLQLRFGAAERITFVHIIIPAPPIETWNQF